MFVTLGLAIPYTRTYLARYRTKHTWFGNRSMGLDAKGRRLYPALFVSFLLYFVVLAVILVLGRRDILPRLPAHVPWRDAKTPKTLSFPSKPCRS